MRAASLIALLLSASIATPASADEQIPPWALSLALSIAPFYMSSQAAGDLSKSTSGDPAKNKQWQVAAMRTEGDRTALELRSEDGATRVDTMVSSAIARAHAVKLHDTLEIEAIGQTGFAVKKAGATLVVMVRPDTGLLHSKART
ncbi:hypothetical protein G4G28_03690 [Massilia sp. Dwa41.01b]|uniref:hypothetical protein n=1 Tax=unclassified Massilia TaxID=2609279 RepID=UPI0015FFF3E6|nr:MULTISPECIES: hypothetical protein [unclassified Massilia]QNA87799.1 hypothetical protein G4G28_03690 [Massilia sp. Dwa41.01b]QNA98700.1 hypothetical protein G4G31_07410 [Massilia sp. Se16.2.3]